MARVSIIIPSRGEVYECQPGVSVLQRTVQDIYEKATGDFEVLVGFDGPPYQRFLDNKFQDYPNLKTFEFVNPIGIKRMINTLAQAATGKYIYKSDAHCMFGKGFDEILQADMEKNWVVTPRFYVLNAEKWEVQDERYYDYFYLCCPFTDPRGFRFKAGGHWPERTKELDPSEKKLYPDASNYLREEIRNMKPWIDETPQMHGSGWFVDRAHFLYDIGGFPSWDPMGHAQEPPYLGLKTWLSDWPNAKLMVNKKTWYAHMHQQGNKRGYHMDKAQEDKSYKIFADYFIGDRWEGRAHDFGWFVEKFLPMPTWPENWKELYLKYKEEHPQWILSE